MLVELAKTCTVYYYWHLELLDYCELKALKETILVCVCFSWLLRKLALPCGQKQLLIISTHITETCPQLWTYTVSRRYATYTAQLSSVRCAQCQTEPSIHIFISNMTLIAILYALTLSNISNFTVIIACQAKGHSLMGLFELLLTSVLW